MNEIMRTKYFIVLLFALVVQVGHSQASVDGLFKQFSKEKQATRVSLGSITLKIASLFGDTMGVNGIEALSLDECSAEVKSSFDEATRNLKDANFETMITSNEGGKRAKILVRIEKEVIKELVVLVTGEDYAMVRIKGNIKKSDIDGIVEKHSK